ncbi:hypothetical protein ECTW09195_1994, partial [Escherichia coli TW09195]
IPGLLDGGGEGFHAGSVGAEICPPRAARQGTGKTSQQGGKPCSIRWHGITGSSGNPGCTRTVGT